MKSIESLLEKAKQGIKIIGDIGYQLKDLITKLSDARGIDKIVTLLTILDIIAKTKEKQFII